MGLMSSKVERKKLRCGDHIYTWRSGYSYSHHGIYMGNGKVVHLTRGPGLIISSSSRFQPSNDRVVCCNIQDFLDDGQLYRFEYGVSIILFVIKRAGTCLIASSNPPEQVLHRASYLLKNEFGSYHLLDKNCEDFAIYCKTGLLKDFRAEDGGNSGQAISLFKVQGGSNSGQAMFLYTVATAIIICPYRFLPATLIGQALMFCGLYYFLRLRQAFGSQSIAAEELDHLSDEHNVRQNMYANMMETTSTKWFLPRRVCIRGILWAIYLILVLDTESKIQEWFRTICLGVLLIYFAKAHLISHGLKLGDDSAYIIYILGYLYLRWTSESTLLLWTRLFFLYGFLLSSISDGARSLTLESYAPPTTLVLELLCCTKLITILQWIKLVLRYLYLFSHVFPSVDYKPLLMLIGIFAGYLTHWVALFLGLNCSDYIYRIRKITFL